MAFLENITCDYDILKEGKLAHHRNFLNLNSSNRNIRFSRRRYSS